MERNKDSQCASPELRMGAKKGAGMLTKDKDGQVIPSCGRGPQRPMSNSSDSDEVSSYMNNWRKMQKDRTYDKIDNCETNCDPSGCKCHLNSISTRMDKENQCASPEYKMEWDTDN